MFRVVKETGQDTGGTDSHASDIGHWLGMTGLFASFCVQTVEKPA